MRIRRGLLSVVAITLLSGHVAPSVDDNNRYLKVTPLADRIRLAYTVLFGEVPGASQRRAIDANQDGRIDDGEADAFARKIAAQVAAALVVEIDGKAWPVMWDEVDAGMGTPVVAAGAFSVDLVASPCLPTMRGRHVLRVKDRFRLPNPGETEVKVEDGPPGVTIEKAHVGAKDDPTYDYLLPGPGGELENDGLEVVWFVAKETASTCRREPASRRKEGDRGLGVALALALGIVSAMGIGVVVLVRSRRRRTRGRLGGP